jgi:beta-fructofuranosidase
MRELFYRPIGAKTGDFIPFYAKGKYRLFYLHDIRDTVKDAGIPWYQISTNDFVNFTEHGEMIPHGKREDQDFYVYTGCVMEAHGRYHIFYTGHNGEFAKQGKPLQAVMHAVSDDLLKWDKIPEDTFYSPGGLYEMDDWRDPFVFWNEEAKEYWMLLAARLKTGDQYLRGCTALCASKDLKSWVVREPFWTPGLYWTHECPDLFRIGDWWYLVFSAFTQGYGTRYRMSRSPRGPWITPPIDTFDTRAFYAAKTASDGQKRYLFGWNPTREQNKDEGEWQWGGNLVVHEITQRPDGTLSVKVPDTIDRFFDRQIPIAVQSSGSGAEQIRKNRVVINAEGMPACRSMGPLPGRCKIHVTLTFTENTSSCGIMLNADEDLKSAYYLRLEPNAHRMTFDWNGSPTVVDLDRSMELSPGRPVELKIFIDGTICEVYVDGTTTLSTRRYNLQGENWGLYVNGGSAEFEVALFQGR